MNNHQVNHINKIAYDECLSRGICSISPTVSYVNEVIKAHLKELAFYLLKLKEMGITNDNIKRNIVEILSGIIVGIEYDQEQFSAMISKLYADLVEAKELYMTIYKKANLSLDMPRSTLKKQPKTNLAMAIRQGQKLIMKQDKDKTSEQKNLFELIFDITKSICVHLIELESLDVKDQQAYDALILLLNTMNTSNDSIDELKDTIEKFVKLDHILFEKLFSEQEKLYGEITPTEVSTSTRPNKAILVSGSNLHELELILEATKDKNIDVYTHGQMLMAHAFPKLKQYKNLVGHFGGGKETYILDFVSFPGAIFLTRHAFYKIEHLYRSRIYTSDLIAPKGVAKIRNGNFAPLIEATMHAKGFTHSREKEPIKLNLGSAAFKTKIKEVAENIKNGKIKNFFTIGVSNLTKVQKDYFEKFLNLLGDESFVLSFSYTNKKNNVLFVESNYGFPMLHRALDILRDSMSIDALNPVVLCTRCDTHTMSNILYLKHLGVKRIYFTDCSPTFINPAVVETMREVYDIKKYTTPQADLKAILDNN